MVLVARPSADTKEPSRCCTSLDSQPTAAPQKFDPIAHYCIVRTDLPVGLACAQLIHAAGESSPGNLDVGTYAIALGVPDEQTLERLASNLEALGGKIHRVVETQGKYRNQLMAIGVLPGPKSVVGRYMTNLKLLSLENMQQYRDNISWWSKQSQAQLDEQSALRLQVYELKQALAATPWQKFKRWWRGA